MTDFQFGHFMDKQKSGDILVTLQPPSISEMHSRDRPEEAIVRLYTTFAWGNGWSI
jgi:hypothetical protein